MFLCPFSSYLCGWFSENLIKEKEEQNTNDMFMFFNHILKSAELEIGLKP